MVAQARVCSKLAEHRRRIGWRSIWRQTLSKNSASTYRTRISVASTEVVCVVSLGLLCTTVLTDYGSLALSPAMNPGDANALRRGGTAVLVHGFDTEEMCWPDVVWGSDRRAGRLVHGISTGFMAERRANLVLLGGTKDSVAAEEHLWANFEDLLNFDVLQGADPKELRKWAHLTIRRMDNGTDARHEAQEAARIFREQGIDRVIIVSSPSHLPRCLRDFLVALDGVASTTTGASGGHPWRPIVFASPCETDMTRSCTAEVAVIEPRHPFSKRVRQMFEIPPGMVIKFSNELDKLLTRWLP